MSLDFWMEGNSTLEYGVLASTDTYHDYGVNITSSMFTDSPLNMGYNTTLFDESMLTTPIPMPFWKLVAHTVFKYVIGTNVIFIMFAMGCAIDWRDIVRNLWPPIGILIGMFGQFIMLPAISFAISKLFKLRPYEALGCLIVSCSPGGTFSNFATFWMEGELALSVVMTTCSSLIALFGMPFNIWLYSDYLVGENAEIVIPVWNIMRGLIFICTPVLIGMLLRHFSLRFANMITKVFGVVAIFGFGFGISSFFIIHYQVFYTATTLIFAGAIIMPVCGVSGAYLVAYLFKRSHKVCRTIGVETGSQNMGIAMTVILFSFDNESVQSDMLLFPTMYGLFMFGETIFMIIVYQVVKRMMNRRKQKHPTDAKTVAYNASKLEAGTNEEKTKIKS